MSARLLWGSTLANQLQAATTGMVERLMERSRSITLVTLLVGENPSALAYRAQIDRTVVHVGITHRPITLPATVTPQELDESIQKLNVDSSVTGILLLLPLPRHLPIERSLERLSPEKDVDGITPTNIGRLQLGLDSFQPSTPRGGIELLDHYGIGLSGQHVVIIGRSNVVGRPLASMLLERDATVTLCHRQTRNIAGLTRQADIVALAAGCPGLLTGEMIRPGAIVLDFGVNVVAGKLAGDADSDSIAEVAAAYTPVPGGTGPVTAQVLARNVVRAAERAFGSPPSA